MERTEHRRSRHSKRNWSQKNSGAKKQKNREPQRGQQVKFGKPARQPYKCNKEISENLRVLMSENEKAIKEFRQNKAVCARCGEVIENIAAALCVKQTGTPIHFDCVVSLLQEQEKITPSERIIYIGKGRFAVAFYPAPQDDKNFTIRRIIEWENTTINPLAPWRQEISGLFSQIK